MLKYIRAHYAHQQGKVFGHLIGAIGIPALIVIANKEKGELSSLKRGALASIRIDRAY
jgi:hypothetical protein